MRILNCCCRHLLFFFCSFSVTLYFKIFKAILYVFFLLFLLSAMIITWKFIELLFFSSNNEGAERGRMRKRKCGGAAEWRGRKTNGRRRAGVKETLRLKDMNTITSNLFEFKKIEEFKYFLPLTTVFLSFSFS